MGSARNTDVRSQGIFLGTGGEKEFKYPDHSSSKKMKKERRRDVIPTWNLGSSSSFLAPWIVAGTVEEGN